MKERERERKRERERERENEKERKKEIMRKEKQKEERERERGRKKAGKQEERDKETRREDIGQASLVPRSFCHALVAPNLGRVNNPGLFLGYELFFLGGFRVRVGAWGCSGLSGLTRKVDKQSPGSRMGFGVHGGVLWETAAQTFIF